MKKTVIAILTVSFCFGSGKLPSKLEHLKNTLQKKYQVNSMEELYKLKNLSASSQHFGTRDMEDLIGDWKVDKETFELLVTVEVDQTVPNPYSLIGIEMAEGSITLTTNDFEEDLNYMMFGLFENGDDCDMDCEGEYYDYMNDGIEVSEDYCSCCQDEYPIDEICNTSWYDLFQYDTGCDGWDGVWYIVNEDEDTVAGGNGPDGECETWTDVGLIGGHEYRIRTTEADSGNEEYSFVLGRTNEYGELETICSGGANANCNFYVEDDHGGGDDDWSPEVIMTNMNLIEFITLMMGSDPGVENASLVGASSTMTEDGDIVCDEVMALLFTSGGEMTVFGANPSDAVEATSIDTALGTLTINNLSLYDSTFTETLSLSGTIGPSMMDLVAGEETVFPYLEGLEDVFPNDNEDTFMSFFEDATGMEIYVEYDDDSEAYMDTMYFDWVATSDSLFLDYEEGEGTMGLEYTISGDTLVAGQNFDICEQYDSFEQCLEDISEEVDGFDELIEVESLGAYIERVLVQGSLSSSMDPGNSSLPQHFNLYSNYPNPFNPMTTIRFDVGLNSGDNTVLRIYDISGRNVATLINGNLQMGTYELQWDAQGFASGIYFSELVSGSYRQTQKMVLLK